MFISIFVSIFVGIEYADGTIRNKVISGHSRTNIYLSNLAISIIGALIIEIVYIIVIAVIGIPVVGNVNMNINSFAVILLDVIMIIICYTAIFNFVSIVCSNITLSTVVCLVITIIMYICTFLLQPIANSEEFYQTAVINENGEIEIQKKINPNYPGEIKKKICKLILYYIPTGQGMEILEYLGSLEIIKEKEMNTKLLPIYSLSVIILISGVGIYLFNKKELK